MKSEEGKFLGCVTGWPEVAASCKGRCHLIIIRSFSSLLQ